MRNPVLFTSRTVKKGKESDFVDTFLKKNQLFEEEHLEYMVLQETIIDGGIPDLLIISWEKGVNLDWSLERKNLNKTDIKILHFISTKKARGVSEKSIKQKLGYTEKQFVLSLKRLSVSNLIEKKGNNLVAKELYKNFFVRDIIAIEAKLNNWKKVKQQAKLNQYFSSKSYVLLPNKKEKTLNYFKDEISTGVISFDGIEATVVKKAKNNRLPTSYFSWIINEKIGNYLDNG